MDFKMNLRSVYTILHIASQHSGSKPPTISYDGLVSEDKTNSSIPLDEEAWIEQIHDLFEFCEPARNWLKQKYETEEKIFILAKLISNHLSECRKNGAQYITLADHNVYPRSLSYIPNPPLAFSYLGTLPKNDQLCIAIIGSRKASHKALQESYHLGELLTNHNSHICIVSGGAYGCDIAAHKGCLTSLKKNCSTAVVFASGLGCLYPKGNLPIFSDLVKRGGALISERLWHESPRPYDFPIRNRIISGLSQKIVVIHAGIKSGAMTTCIHALEQGRDIYVLIPPLNDQTMDGNYKLISEGANIFYTAEEFMWNL